MKPWKVYIRELQENYYLGEFRSELTIGQDGSHKYVFEKNGQKLFFKEDSVRRQDLKFGELFTTFLYKDLGIDKDAFIEYKMAEIEVPDTDYKYKGLISSYFLPDGAKRLSAWDIKVFNLGKLFGWDLSDYFDNQDKEDDIDEKVEDLITIEFGGSEYRSSVEDIIQNVKDYAKNYNLEVDIDDIELRLKQMIVLDFFLVQKDRHMGNIEFYEHNGKLHLCPIFDSEYALGLDHEDYYKDTFSSDRKRFRMRTGLSTAGGTVGTYRDSKLFKHGGIVAVDILEEVKHDKRIKTLVDKCLKLDINKQLEDFEKRVTFLKRYQQDLIKNDFLKRRSKFYEVIDILKKKTGRKDIYKFKEQEKDC
ncbi:MAG: hypothetical protein IJF22_00015 [Clostridia bacterium]|nr:hypothetical protein [Clostridia bacterium]